MIRRFEIYRLRPDAPATRVAALETACRRAGDFIPEVLYSAVGRNRSDVPVDVVWEHAFASPDAYRRYMVHPYHASVLDRYLLHDSPERVVTDDALGAGLVGYRCSGPVFDLRHGIRRLVLFRVDRYAPPAAVVRLEESLVAAVDDEDTLTLSTFGANTLGPAWFDAVTPLTGTPRWTHLWEQGFGSTDDLEAYRVGSSPLAEADRNRFVGWRDGIVERAVSLHYEMEWPDRPVRRPQDVQE